MPNYLLILTLLLLPLSTLGQPDVYQSIMDFKHNLEADRHLNEEAKQHSDWQEQEKNVASFIKLELSLKRINQLLAEGKKSLILQEFQAQKYAKSITKIDISLKGKYELLIHITTTYPPSKLDLSEFKYLNSDQVLIYETSIYSKSIDYSKYEIAWLPKLEGKNLQKQAEILKTQIVKIYHKYRSQIGGEFDKPVFPEEFWEAEQDYGLPLAEQVNFRKAIINFLYLNCTNCVNAIE